MIKLTLRRINKILESKGINALTIADISSGIQKVKIKRSIIKKMEMELANESHVSLYKSSTGNIRMVNKKFVMFKKMFNLQDDNIRKKALSIKARQNGLG